MLSSTIKELSSRLINCTTGSPVLVDVLGTQRTLRRPSGENVSHPSSADSTAPQSYDRLQLQFRLHPNRLQVRLHPNRLQALLSGAPIVCLSTFTDGCDLTSIYSVCATQDNAEHVKLKKRETIKKNQMSESNTERD